MKITWRIASLLIIAMFLGCGGKDKDSANSENRYEPDSQANNSRTEVVSPSAGDGRSPASRDQQIAAEALPDEIVVAFINSLNDGDADLAEALLTDIARVETKRANLVVQQPWSPAATYELGRVEYATGHPIRCEVATQWDDPAEESITSPRYSIVWLLFKQPHNGWRICGMKTDFIPNGDMVYLNFEDPADMIPRWEQALMEAAGEDSGVRSADAGNTTEHR